MKTTIRLWIVRETAAAYQFSTTPENRQGELVWIPRSMVERITKFAEQPERWRECEAEIQEWFAEKKGLI